MLVACELEGSCLQSCAFFSTGMSRMLEANTPQTVTSRVLQAHAELSYLPLACALAP